MIKQIWKYSLMAGPKETLMMPKGATILSVQVKRQIPCLWVECDPKAPKEERMIETFGTGEDIPCDMGVERKYIGTFIVEGHTPLVFHVYERIS